MSFRGPLLRDEGWVFSVATGAGAFIPNILPLSVPMSVPASGIPASVEGNLLSSESTAYLEGLCENGTSESLFLILNA